MTTILPYDVIIVGGGVAGMTAAIYALRAGMRVLLIEEKILGGQIVEATDVRNWPGEETISGEKLAEKIYHQMNKLGKDEMLEVVYAKVEKVENSGELVQIWTDEQEDGQMNGAPVGVYTGYSLIIATGSRERKMGVPGEVEMIGKGVSYCATCDGELYRGKDVAVVGGGNTAFYDVLYLANLARKVYLVHRREEFRAEKALVEKVRWLKNVEMVLGYVPERVLGKEKVEELEVRRAAEFSGKGGSGGQGSGEEKESQALGPARVEKRELPVSGIFVAVGREPATEVFSEVVELDKEGHVVAVEDCRTSARNVFAAGDCRTKGVRQLVTAAADGAVAAGGMVEYLNNM